MRELHRSIRIRVQKCGVQLELGFIHVQHAAFLAVDRPQINTLRAEGMVQQRHEHVARQHCQLVVEAEDVLRRLIVVPRGADALKNRRKRLQPRRVCAFHHKAHTHALHRVPRLQQRAHLIFPQGAPVIAHDGHQRFHRAAAAVIAHINALPRLDLYKAQLFKLHQSGCHHRARHAHLSRKLPRRRQLLAYGKLAGEYHVFYLLYEKIRHRQRCDLAEAHGSLPFRNARGHATCHYFDFACGMRKSQGKVLSNLMNFCRET